MATISVITSTFNRSDRIRKCIESVQKQTFKDYEHIIVDDGSTDDTEKVVKGFNDPRIVYHKRTKNFGCDTKPKNEGIKKAKADYIAFLDDDCTYRPDHLQALWQNKGEYDLVYGDRWIVDETKEVKPQLGFTMDYNPYYLLRRNFIDTSDVLVKKSVLLEVGGFDERYRKYIDWNLWVRLAKAGKQFKRVPLILTDYHLHKQMKSLRKEDEKDFNVPAWDPIDCDITVPYLGKVKQPRVAIFSLTHDRLEYTKQCFKSLQETAGYAFDHYVIDNGSTDGTKDWLTNHYSFQYPNVKVYDFPDNRGIATASNKALNAIQGYNLIGKVDNDCLFLSQGWLATMVTIWQSNRMLALSCYIQGLKDNPGGAPRLTYGQIKGELVGMANHLGGICHFVDAKAYQDFRWDETQPLHGVQDLELSTYLKKQGYQMAYLENWYAEHIDGTEGQHKKYPDYFERRKYEKTHTYQK
jgi:glycosyltransferase involved in cell wall biosynthesis